MENKRLELSIILVEKGKEEELLLKTKDPCVSQPISQMLWGSPLDVHNNKYWITHIVQMRDHEMSVYVRKRIGDIK